MPILGSFSSLSARGYGFNTQSISVDANVSPTNLTEGTQITVTVNTSGIGNGTTLYYTISGSLGTITAADFTDNSLSGSFIINNDAGSFTKTVASDGAIENGEAFLVEIRQDSITGPILDTTTSVYIQSSQATGVVRIQPPINGVEFWDFAANGTLILDGGTSTSYTLTAMTNVRFTAFIWGQGGDNSTGGYSSGTITLNQNDVLYMRLNYGAGSSGQNYGWVSNGTAGGLAGIFSSSNITQANARLIAGGGGGSGLGHGSSPGGSGGGSSGGSGTNSSNTEIGSTGGGGGTQSAGGGGGGGGGSSGSALQGGSGGAGQLSGYPNAGGGGGGGGGYYGGGGGGGGNDFGNTTRDASGGGGGSGYVHSSIINGFTGGYSNGSSHPDRGNAGSAGYNSRIALRGTTTLTYFAGNYTVNVPSTATSMSVKIWAAGGEGAGECPTGSFSGGSGGYVEGKISVTGGSTVSVYVGESGVGSKTSPYSQAGYGAGNGGGLSAVSYGANILVAGGGGGAGQNGQGGYGGANGSGGSGSGPNNGGAGSQSGGGGGGSSDDRNGGSGDFWSSGSNLVNGGNSGGSGQSQGNRGGGGGAGYYGGGGGGGYSGSNCSGGGGGGGSGIITGSWTNTVSYNGQTGTGGGRTAINSGDSNYVPGYGGSSQNGLVVLIFE